MSPMLSFNTMRLCRLLGLRLRPLVTKRRMEDSLHRTHPKSCVFGDGTKAHPFTGVYIG